MSRYKVWLGGEGPCELGDRDQWEGARRRQGALEALLSHVRAEGWEVLGATRWRSLHKFKVGAAIGKASHADTRNVQALALKAKEQGATVLAFTRDLDTDVDRATAIENGIAAAQARSPDLAIVGGVAKPTLEGWILALRGDPRTDELSPSRANDRIAALGLGGKQAEDYVAVIERADLAHLPDGCQSLQTWLQRARAALGGAPE